MSFLCVLKISKVFRNKDGKHDASYNFFPQKRKAANSFTHPFYKSKESEQIKQIIESIEEQIYITDYSYACNNALSNLCSIWLHKFRDLDAIILNVFPMKMQSHPQVYQQTLSHILRFA